MKLKHKFVEFIPETIDEGILYVSLEFGTILHKCACGCGKEVNTPLNPNEWRLTYNGESISIRPSIGNWSFKCESHYWITENEVEWASKWSKKKILKEREKEIQERHQFYLNKSATKEKVIDENFEKKEEVEVPLTRKWYESIFFWR